MPPDAAHAAALGIDGCGAFRSGEGVEMFCPKCGAENPDGAKFCVKCGAGLPVVQKAEPVVAGSGAVAEDAAAAPDAASTPTGSDAAVPAGSGEAASDAGA
ncbi:zinc-ribbon domain-containing protein, partial [uncultured Enorma sp.]|uniref:zinc ribbon domain-containing protein n=1 Tax=uncultured Enorma sp. TaxID=1714346 RepID=UPI002805BE26